MFPCDLFDRCDDMRSVGKDVQDTTAVNDVDSGLQMAVSPCSALSTSLMTAALKDPHYSSDSPVITKSRVGGNSGMWHLILVAHVHSLSVYSMSQPPPTHAGWSHSIWHNFVIVGDN